MVALLLAVLPSGWALAGSPTSESWIGCERLKVAKERPRSQAKTKKHGSHSAREDGETIESAFMIATLPFQDAGNTCGNDDDYDEVCPWESTSPDVVYAYTVPFDMTLEIRLCDSSYDTKLFVYEDTYTPGDPIACNDDWCGDDGYKSELYALQVIQGATYYIVVDGYGGDCGDYVIEVAESLPCCVDCPPGSEMEGEPICYENYEDEYNAGCCCETITFSILEPAPDRINVCGTGGTFLLWGFDMRGFRLVRDHSVAG
jgi:hypothetical protein